MKGNHNLPPVKTKTYYKKKQFLMTPNQALRTVIVTTLLVFSAISVTGQDLLARQAPVDRRAKKLDSIQVKSFAERENLRSPAAALYGDDWDNRYAHRPTELPDSFTINLRHFCMPTPSRVVTSNFGSRWGRQHKGLDIKVYIGDTIRAAFSGKVRIVKYEAGGYGNYVVIRHYNGLETIYAHMSKQLVRENEVVKAGEPIGLGGNTGRSTGSHLHFETRLCGIALNPALFFDFRNQDVIGDYYVFNKRTYDNESKIATRERGKVGNGGYTRDMVQGKVGRSEEPASTAVRNAANMPERVYYKVVSGDTLSSIAEKCGVTVERLCHLNGFKKNQRIRPGQIIRYV